MVRFSADAYTGYFAYIRNKGDFSANTEARLYKVIGGSYTELGAVDCSKIPAVWRLTVEGNTLTLTREGMTILTATDSSIPGGVRAGIFLFTGSYTYNAWVDDFRAQALAGDDPVIQTVEPLTAWRDGLPATFLEDGVAGDDLARWRDGLPFVGLGEGSVEPPVTTGQPYRRRWGGVPHTGGDRPVFGRSW